MARLGEIGRNHEFSLDGLTWGTAARFPEIFELVTPASQAVETAAVVAAEAADPTLREGAAEPATPEALWYRAIDGVAVGPMPRSCLLQLIRSGEVTATTFVYQERTPAWVTAGVAPELATGFESRPRPEETMDPAPDSDAASRFEFSDHFRRHHGEKRSRAVAVTLALLLGGLGIHRFYLGNPATGLLYLLFCWTLVPLFCGIVDALAYLNMSDESFDRKYNW